MSNIFTPTNQKLLTNIAVVRLNRGGKRFEIACYKNKVVNWRDGAEKDINEVIQVPDKVFMNVSKGELAKKEVLKKCFDTDNLKEICLLILNKGELQLSEKERKEMQDNKFKEISVLIADMCIDPETQVPVQQTLVQNAMKEIHFNVKPAKCAKTQAVALIPHLQEVIKIQRTEMKVKVTIPVRDYGKIKTKLAELLKVESEDKEENMVVVGLVAPGGVKVLTDLVQQKTRGSGSVDIVSLQEI